MYSAVAGPMTPDTRSAMIGAGVSANTSAQKSAAAIADRNRVRSIADRRAPPTELPPASRARRRSLSPSLARRQCRAAQHRVLAKLGFCGFGPFREVERRCKRRLQLAVAAGNCILGRVVHVDLGIGSVI